MKQDVNHKMLRHSSFRRQSSYIVLVVLEGGHNQPTINLLMYIRCNNCLRKPSTMRYYSFRVASGSRTKTLTLWAINGYYKWKVVKMGNLAVSLRSGNLENNDSPLWRFVWNWPTINWLMDRCDGNTFWDTTKMCWGGEESIYNLWVVNCKDVGSFM